MSRSPMDLLTEALGSGASRQIGQQLGVDEDAASRAIAGALPTLMAALARNSSSPEGADALAGALDRDHDGGILDDVGGYLGQGPAATSTGEGILRHALGGRQARVQNGIGKMSGLDTARAGQLLAMLAPLVMGALGKAKRQKGLDAGGLGALLGQERRRVERRDPGAMGMLGSLLDRDGDGDVTDDLAKIGTGMLGSLLGGRRR